MNKDQIKGRVEEAKGKVKEGVAKVTGNRDLDDKAQIDQAAGKTRADYGDAKSALKDTLKNR